jgi:putative glutamine amidotransferase
MLALAASTSIRIHSRIHSRSPFQQKVALTKTLTALNARNLFCFNLARPQNRIGKVPMKYLLMLWVGFMSLTVHADLLIWRPAFSPVPFLLYKAPEETPVQATQRYLDSVRSNPELSSLVGSLQYTLFDRFESPTDSQLQSLLIANSFEDHQHSPSRLENFLNPLRRQNISGAVLPIGVLYKKTKAEEESFHQEIASRVRLLVPMGGADVEPSLYGQRTNGAVNTKPLRDQLEINIIQNYYRRSMGKIFAVCRGMQITSVALGYQLNQELRRDLQVQEEHAGGTYHDILLQKTQNSILRNAFAGLTRVRVDSHHHQSFKIDGLNVDRRLQVAALSPEGVVEALESKDNRILLVQFHPEKMDMFFQSGQWVFSIFKNWVAKPASATPAFCRQVYR